MRWEWIPGFAAIAWASVLSTPAVAAGSVDCWNTDEISAARLDDFQMMLMVGALKCRNTSSSAVGSYNGFIESKRTTIAENRVVMREHFSRIDGQAAAAVDYSNFQTWEGNRHSNTAFDADRCEEIGAYARLAQFASPADLMTLSRMTSSGDLPACPTQSAPDGANIVRLEDSPIVAPDEGLAPGNPAIQATSYNPAGAETAMTSDEAVPAASASEEPAAPVSSTSAAQALSDAAKSLAAAAQAMQTAPQR